MEQGGSSGSEESLEDGPVIKAISSEEREKFEWIELRLKEFMREMRGVIKWVTYKNKYKIASISFAGGSPCWELGFDIHLRHSEYWAVVEAHTITYEYRESFRSKDMCLGYIIHFTDIQSKIGKIEKLINPLLQKLALPEKLFIISKGPKFPYICMNLSKKISRDVDSVCVYFEEDGQTWPDEKWAKVEVVSGKQQPKSEIRFFDSEKDTFNFIVSKADTGMELDYYGFATSKPNYGD